MKFRVSGSLGRSILCACAAAAILSSVQDAQAARRKAARASYSPPSASFILDVNSGKALHAANADSLRHPASLTKIMTLYLLFERIESGQLTLTSPLKVSSFAAEQAPTKLGLKPGQTIAVEDAIKGLVTKSANDAAVVVAEAIAEDEESFAALMTKKARALGMSRTIYRNASGLPDDEQVTTAREQALLGQAIQERFPRLYRYFAIQSFRYRGMAMRNHNRLLGNVEGVDGIKTGYTRASGFNLVSSVRRGNRHLIGVVLGGRSAAARDSRMRDLIAATIVEASARRTAPTFAEATPRREAKAASPKSANDGSRSAPSLRHADPAPTAAIAQGAHASPSARPISVSVDDPLARANDPLQPILVKTITVRPAHSPATAPVRTMVVAATPLAPLPAESRITPEPSIPVATQVAAQVAAAPKPSEEAARRAPPSALPEQPAHTAAPARSGWVIQIGAYDDESEARARLAQARSKVKRTLDGVEDYTERFIKGEKTYYRARFTGFDKPKAEAACKVLKRNDFACLALRI